MANVSSISDPHSGRGSLPRLMIKGKMCVGFGMASEPSRLQEPRGGLSASPLAKEPKINAASVGTHWQDCSIFG